MRNSHLKLFEYIELLLFQFGLLFDRNAKGRLLAKMGSCLAQAGKAGGACRMGCLLRFEPPDASNLSIEDCEES